MAEMTSMQRFQNCLAEFIQGWYCREISFTCAHTVYCVSIWDQWVEKAPKIHLMSNNSNNSCKTLKKKKEKRKKKKRHENKRSNRNLGLESVSQNCSHRMRSFPVRDRFIISHRLMVNTEYETRRQLNWSALNALCESRFFLLTGGWQHDNSSSPETHLIPDQTWHHRGDRHKWRGVFVYLLCAHLYTTHIYVCRWCFRLYDSLQICLGVLCYWSTISVCKTRA